MLRNKSEAIPVVDPREPLDLLLREMRVNREEPEITRTLGQMVVEPDQSIGVLRTNGTHPDMEMLERDCVVFQIRSVPTGYTRPSFLLGGSWPIVVCTVLVTSSRSWNGRV